MYDDAGDDSETYQNAPNQSMINIMYSTTFGTGSFMIQPPSPGEVGQGWPSVPYLSVEAIFYQQMATNPLSSPVNTLSGSNVGEQVIQGQYTSTDGSGTSRYLQGYQGAGSNSILNTSGTVSGL